MARAGRLANGRSGTRRRLRVDLGERAYPVDIGTGTLDELGDAVAKRLGARRVAVVTVPPVGRRYGARVQRSLTRAGIRSVRITVPDGDRTKNLRQVHKLYDAFLGAGMDRTSAVVALGGGVVGDLSGFAAASFLRGIPFVQVPTTLLSMVDSSIGGKTGVNLPQGKNLVGAFHQPALVWIDVETLRTLPVRQRVAGLAEVIKAGALWDARFFRRLERELEAVLALDPGVLVPVLHRACGIKAEVVAQDEREGGVRMRLNFGHTLAHAVERIFRYRGVLHGEAVGMGMVFAAHRSVELGFAPRGHADRIEALVARAGLPTRLPDRPRGAYLEALRVDKKKRDAHIRFVVLREIGRTDTVPLTPAQILPRGWRAAQRAGRAS